MSPKARQPTVDEIYSHARSRWLEGRCPCCGSADVAGDPDARPIAEGVLFCGLCCDEGRAHHEDREHVRYMLRALLP